ncbi:MAG TPA: hypothetical protein ENJ02_01010 [Chloroflexi bacterium]|nr:hypothetical protein [Chloroflexota bacterium]
MSPSNKFHPITIFLLLAGLLLACTAAGQSVRGQTPSPAKSPSATTLSPDKWALWSSGTRLRGTNVYQRRVYPELDEGLLGSGDFGPPFTQADFDHLAALGANYVNLSHPGLYTETPPYQVDPAAQANLDAFIQMAANANLYVVITARTGPGRSEFWAFWGEDTASDPEYGWFDPSYYNNRVWGEQDAQDAWVAMWRYTAERYKDNPAVVGYDLMCEPNSNDVGSYPLGDPLDVWDPAQFQADYGGTLYDWNQLYPRIVSAIREVDTATPILVGGNGYSAPDWLPYMQVISDTRTVYTIHQYDPHTYTHQLSTTTGVTYPGYFDTDWDGTPEDFNRAWLESLLSDTVDAFRQAHGGVPVAANEYGLVRWAPGAPEFMDDQMALFEQRGMNYALWEWSTTWEPFASTIHDFNFRYGPDPANRADTQNALQDAITSYWARNAARPFGTVYLPLMRR